MPDQRVPDPDVEKIGELLAQVGRALFRKPPPRPDAVVRNLTLAQLNCLWLVERHEGCAMGELSRLLEVTPSTVTALVDRLARDGLISRHGDPADRRVVRLSLAARGLRLTKQRRAHHAEALQASVGSLSPAQRRAMQTALETLVAVLQDAGAIESSDPPETPAGNASAPETKA